MAENRYIQEMQVARGIGILLVTIGHSEPVGTVFPHLFSLIYAFHMPLFFFLSGFFSSKLARIGSLREWVAVVPSRLVYLIIPYLTVSAAYGLIKYFVPQFALRPVVPGELPFDILVYPSRNPALFLWFLYTIIMIQAISPLLSKVNPYPLFGLLLVFQFFRPDIEAFGIGLVLYYSMYYYLGLKAFTVQDRFLSFMKRKEVSLVAFLIFLIAYLVRKKTGIQFLGFFTALPGIAFVISICFSYMRYFPVRTLETLGKYSFSIYLLQYFFIFPTYFLLHRLGAAGYLIVPCTFLAGSFGPLLLVFYVFPHARLLSLLFSGLVRSRKEAG